MNENKKLIEFLEKARPPSDDMALEMLPRQRLIGAAMIMLMCQGTKSQDAIQELHKLGVDDSEIQTVLKEVTSHFASLN